jgi:ariadne-1
MRYCSAATSGGYSVNDDDIVEDDNALTAVETSHRQNIHQGHGSDRDALKDLRDAQVAEVSELLDMTSDDALLSLRHFRWDSDALSETFFDDPDSVRSRVGISECKADEPGSANSSLCGICFCESPAQVGLSCRGHGYCEDCWSNYVSLAVEEGKRCLDLGCPAPKCGQRLRPTQVRNLCARPELAHRYERFMLDAFVEESTKRKWCPGVGCNLACSPCGGSRSVVHCGCGMSWCFECSNDEHQPVSCQCVKDWIAKTIDEGDNCKWIMANTKNCPKCKNPIEKNGGCMHMTCRPPGGCHHEFCWICLKDWKGHVNCNAPPERKDVLDARSDLARYGHYWERFHSHEQAQKVSAREVKNKMKTLVSFFTAEKSFSVKDVEFLLEAAEQMAKCRRFLKWTYAFAYFLKGSETTVKLFEFHQGQLEGTLERLSDVVENTQWEGFLGGGELSNRPFYDKRAQTISLTNVVRDFFDSLCQWVQETFPERS